MLMDWRVQLTEYQRNGKRRNPGIRLTRTEQTALLDRPYDAIENALLNSDDVQWNDFEIDQAYTRLEAAIRSGTIPTDLTDCEKDVLQDMVEGSTWLSLWDDYSEQKAAAYRRVFGKVMTKVSQAIGREVKGPPEY